MAIFVTGGSGYIGSHTVVELQNAGYDVIVCDNLSNSSRKSLERVKQITGKEVPFYEADIRDRDAMNAIFDKEKIEMTGEAVITMNNACIGNSVAVIVRNAPYFQDEADYIYEWTVDGERVGTEKRFVIDDPSYAGCQLMCRVRSSWRSCRRTARCLSSISPRFRRTA